ncbi:ATP-dependent rRNA helicase RRP3 [Penicillium chermesinum]|nr:ATP-dependent rRNA helicase RRP3 [Penicillium chermesinum]
MIEDTQRLNLLLQNLGFSPTPIDNSLPQRTHLAFVKAFHSKKPALLITTHAVANELKIPPVNFMIYYDIPPDRLTYKDQTSERVDLEKGKVFSLVASNEMKLWNRIIRDQGCVPQLPLDKDEVLRFADEVKTAQKLAARDP